jgi:hypothetical protein
MDQPAAVGYLIDAVLATGLISCTITAGIAAAIPVAIGYRAGTWAAIRWHGHRTARWAEAYANHPGIRAATDHHNQPRKENPQP